MMMKRIRNTLEQVARHCQENGVRLTGKREKVLSCLLSSRRALSAYELVDYCKTEFQETIPAMSVYRILDFLQGQSLVHKLSLSNKYVACSHITCGHKHEVSQFLICGECQRVEEVAIGRATVKKLHEDADKEGFRITNPQIEIDCVCKGCVAIND